VRGRAWRGGCQTGDFSSPEQPSTTKSEGAPTEAKRQRARCGSIDLGALTDDFVVPSNIVRFGLPIAPDSAAVGAKSVADDPRFLTMWMNAVSGSDDADSDGIADDQDLCLARAGANYANHDDRTDANADGLGDSCETWCFVASDDEFADLFDFDGDGVDDSCDNAYTRFNPSQFADR